MTWRYMFEVVDFATHSPRLAHAASWDQWTPMD